MVPKPVSFTANLVAIPQNSEGAARYLAQIAKPTNVPAGMKKLRDLHAIFEGEVPWNNRSRDQVLSAASTIWLQLRHAVQVGDWFDRASLYHSRADLDPNDPAREYARPLSVSLAGRDKKTVWKPFLPVVHMAAGFRSMLSKTSRLRFFAEGSVPRSVQIDELRTLLFDDHEWLSHAVEAGEARLVIPRLMGMQLPAETRIFVLTEAFSQETPPGSQI